MNGRLIALVGAVLTVLADTGAAAAAGEHEHRQHDAHEHGRGTLQVALDGDELVMVLRIPAANVIGFEHAAHSEVEREAVRDALARFQRPSGLFRLTDAAGCKVEHVQASLDGAQEGHDEHGHGQSHAEKHDEHASNTAEQQERHSELHAEYHFQCSSPAALEAVEVKLFPHLPGAEQLEAQVVTTDLQTVVRLRPDNTTVPLRP